jgi:predicted hydrocarbon binding protein
MPIDPSDSYVKQVKVKKERMSAFLESISDVDPHQSLALLTMGLASLYRGAFEEKETILEFCDIVSLNVKNFIDNPPPYIQVKSCDEEGKATDGESCECPACRFRRLLEAAITSKLTESKVKEGDGKDG